MDKADITQKGTLDNYSTVVYNDTYENIEYRLLEDVVANHCLLHKI